MQFGSGGTGTSSHIGCVLLNQVIGVNLTHVPYRGGGPALVDLLGGRIDYLCNILSTAVEPIKAGQVNALAMLAPERAPVLPELKTAHEQGLDNAEAYTWNAVFLPKGTPSEIVGRLNAALVKVMNNPAFQQKLDPLGLAVVAPARRSPEYLGRFVASEIDKWAGPIKASGAVGE
jgi:tripartite-type tricarboxylate transporter receptor subunit TctC